MKTFYTTLDYAASCLDLSPDLRHVVIAGSRVFKIFTIEDNKFIEKINLYAPKSKTVNANFSSSDVAWNPNDEHRLATVASNGAVVTWNLQKPSRSKLDLIYKDHEKSVNKVNFHPTDPNLLISGSRAGVIKLFDMREKDATAQFNRNPNNPECIRDVQFNPFSTNIFAAATESGNIQLWDMRKTDKVEYFFTGHGDYVIAIDWHPDDRDRFATASRDRTIKIWDFARDGTASNVVAIRTAASVGRIKWKPDNRHHIASCGLTIGSISVWDLRRPYIPYATFNEHSNCSTGIVWQGTTSNLLSVGKDKTLYYHAFEDAVRPAEKANPVALNVSPHLDICSAKPVDGNKKISEAIEKNLAGCESTDDEFQPVSSKLYVFSLKDTNEWGSSTIKEFALNYKLNGRSLNEMCSHNAEIARKLHQMETAHTWSSMQILFAMNSFANAAVCINDSKSEASIESEMKQSVRHYSGETVEASVTYADDGDGDLDDIDIPDKLIEIAKGEKVDNSFFYGEEDMPPITIDEDHGRGLSFAKVGFQLPDEAIVSREDVDIRFSSLPPVPEEDSAALDEALDIKAADIEPRSPPPDDDGICEYFEFGEEDDRNFELNTNIYLPRPPTLDACSLVKETLEYFAAKGDVQLSVSLIIVLGDIAKDLISENVMEQWFLSYIDILHRLKLWNTATEIINLASNIPFVNQLNLESTSFRIRCGNCDAVVPPRKYVCRKCKKPPSKCCICHLAVHGVYTWCQGCGHGGHLKHITEWINFNPYCPSGCGHICEYV